MLFFQESDKLKAMNSYFETQLSHSITLIVEIITLITLILGVEILWKCTVSA